MLNTYNIPADAIELLGAGTDAIVYKAVSDSGAFVAVKVNKPGKHRHLLKEMKILLKLKNPNIVRMISYHVDGSTKDVRIKLELESLHDSLHNHFSEFYYEFPYPVRDNFLKYRLNQKQLAWMCRHIGGALAYLHGEHKILHGDIKSDNIMTNKRLTLFKLIDFGRAVQLPKGVGSRSLYVGSEICMPPECMTDDLDNEDGSGNEEDGIESEEDASGNEEDVSGNEEDVSGNEEDGSGNEEDGSENEEDGSENEEEGSDDVEDGVKTITFAADIYTFGCTLYECLTGTHFNEVNWPLATHEMLNDSDRRYEYPKIIDLINSCLDANPEARPSASGVKEFISIIKL